MVEMKRTIILIAFLALSISIPMLAESNDSTQVNLENIVIQNQEVKLTWYKTLKYEFGYRGGVCDASTPFEKAYHGIFDVSANLNWFNTFKLGIILPSNKWGVGYKYGWWPHLTNRNGAQGLILPDSMYYYKGYNQPGYEPLSNKLAIYFNGIYLNYYIKKLFYCGVSLEHFIVNAEESLGYYSPDSIPGYIYRKFYTQWKCLGGTMHLGVEKHIIKGGFEIIPFVRLQLGYAKEYKNNIPSDWKRNKLSIGTSGIFLGVNIRVGGKR
jgi:hypothetical protein